ncbi:MAG TPA: glycosyltransferase, partial [Solirubrobacteraceae bacterium]|nr:glycosyltransferase [Solirubrobacteraceae bacterium]
MITRQSGTERSKRVGRTSDDDRVHVVTLVESIGSGGAERVALEIAVRLDATRFRSTVCVTRIPHGRQMEGAARERREAHERLAAESGVRVLALGRRTTWQLWTWLPLVSMLLRERPAVIHGHMFGSNVWAVVIGRLTGVPCVVAHDHNACDEPGHDDDLAAR